MPATSSTDVLTPRQLAFITERIPGNPAGHLAQRGQDGDAKLLTDTGHESLRSRQFVHDQEFRPLIPTRWVTSAGAGAGEHDKQCGVGRLA